jgi:UDP-N-acetylglucosamine--N-acetylmuramyl-(pentapeptide) pyrophosphoryl-undecaprenol N-acetylglucosamine transferase
VNTVVIAAGGTAGHVVPALAVADALRDRGWEVLFAGSQGGPEEGLVRDAGYPIRLLRVEGLDRSNPFKALRSVVLAAAAIPGASKLLSQSGARVVIGGGGFVAGPVGAAARLRRLPLVLMEADRTPGLTTRLLSGGASAICLAFPVEGLGDGRVEVTGRPVRREILTADRERARKRFGLTGDRACLLVFGGSHGARSINMAAVEGLGLDSDRDYEVIHVTGRRDFRQVERMLEEAGRPPGYRLLDYEPDLGDCLAVSDLVVARSGGSVFELAATGSPAILVPYPHATGAHQKANAEWMRDAGAAVIVEDEKLDPAGLRREVSRLLADRELLGAMSESSRDLAREDAADQIADLVIEVAGGTA